MRVSPYLWFSSGLVFLDWDQKGSVPDPVLRDATKERLSKQPGVLSVYESVGGYGLHVIVAVDPEPKTAAEYRHIWTILTNDLDLPPGGDEKVNQITRLALASYDPDLRINPDVMPYAWVAADAPPEATTRAQRKADTRSRRFFHYEPETPEEWLCLVATHYGATVADPDRPDFKMPCVYHGGSKPTSLHLWMSYRRLADDDSWQYLSPLEPTQEGDRAGIEAHCFVCESPSKTILQFLEWETRVQTPLTVDLWASKMVPTGQIKKGKPVYVVDPRIDLGDQVVDVLDALRLEMRSPEPEGGLEVRTLVVNDEAYPLPRLLRETAPNAKPGEWIYVTDSIFSHLRGYVQRAVRKDIVDSKYTRTLTTLAPPVNVRVEWLDTLPQWDGKHRLRTMFYDALSAIVKDGEGNTNLTGMAGEWLMVGLVARAYDPGCVHDWMPVLVGAQGLGKSRFCKDLFPRALQARWHADGVAVDQDTQRLAESAGPCWVAEFSEMRGVRSLKAVEHFKSLVSAQKDRYRRPYAVAPGDHLRAWVGIGTANGEEAIPDDPTGSRRFIAIECGENADWNYMPKNREQLWAEAIVIYRGQKDEEHPRNLVHPAYALHQQEQNADFMVVVDSASEDLAEALHRLRRNHIGYSTAASLVTLWGKAQDAQNPGNLSPTTPKPPDEKRLSVFGTALGLMGWRRAKRVWEDAGGKRRTRWWYEPKEGEVF